MRSWGLSRIIGLYGKMHTGKSFVASDMAARWPDQVVVMSFAGKLRQVLKGLDIPETRESLQGVGQKLREFNSDVWVNAVDSEVKEKLSSGQIVVFDDLRYPNEFEYIRNLGGLLVKLYADTDERWKRYGTSRKFNPSITKEVWLSQQEHLSETILDTEPMDWNLNLDTSNMDKVTMNSVATSLMLSVAGSHKENRLNDR